MSGNHVDSGRFRVWRRSRSDRHVFSKPQNGKQNGVSAIIACTEYCYQRCRNYSLWGQELSLAARSLSARSLLTGLKQFPVVPASVCPFPCPKAEIDEMPWPRHLVFLAKLGVGPNRCRYPRLFDPSPCRPVRPEFAPHATWRSASNHRQP